MGTDTTLPAAERLVSLFDRLRKQALDQNPLEEHGITGPQLALLNWLADSPGSGIREIAAGLGLTAPTVSVGVRKLEAAGLVERRPDPKDGRAIQLFLTPQGQGLHQQARAFRREKMGQLLSELTPEESARLLALLEKAIGAAEEKSN